MDILYLKMVALIFVLFLPGSSSFLEFLESNTCFINDDSLSCICKNREDISLNPMPLSFDVRQIEVSGCGVVVVRFGAISHLELEKIIFSDISKLVISAYSFIGALSLYILQIEDIAVFNVTTAGFTGLLNVTDIIIRNISSMYIQEDGFEGISTVENFMIESTNFVEIKKNAFILSNINTFKVVDSKINVMKSNSFLIHNANSVSFQNCSIQEARNHSFSMAYIDSVTFFECNFGILDTNSVHLKYPGSLRFESCTVSELNKHAFSLVDLIKSVTFSHNVIKVGYDSPLYLGSENSSNGTDIGTDIGTENVSIFICCNSFSCNCDIYWMWISEEPFYDIRTSVCIGTETSLSEITPVLDSYGKCESLNGSISVSALLRISIACLIILYGLTMFLCLL